ncbi:type II toxin-antitoxin system RelE/ParE family toxin [Photorhabdus luminescens]|uniref:Type II toxin-antitoxin system mRNA interferase toxin, RelE/StbE family n=1 Tax=Photorhabdus luminescens subsp. sonorensis TaxID=1173677 RepID=A0A5C4RKJ4_PHOLU|nr:type II toxin-antitoxin system YafQ family toxin [Photorhabdus luminescens]TNH44636.1 hypothetical protein EP164_03760 [Photorhabdus luminescens subsp. sonorensis]
MLIFVYQSRFKGDAKKYVNNKKAQEIIMKTLALLQTGQPLPPKYKEHRLNGNYPRHLSSCLFVGCTHSPRSHSYLCSRGFVPLPSRCILKSIGYILVIWNVMEHRIYY